MDLLPAIRSWDGLHPLVAHVPVALLLVAPLFIAVSLFAERARGWTVAALVVMTLGTAAAYVSVSTGRAASARIGHGAGMSPAALERHQELAESTRGIFSALTLVFATLVLAPLLARRPLARGAAVAATAIYLALYAGGTLVLVSTTRDGGRLVQDHGAHAAVAPAAGGGRD